MFMGDDCKQCLANVRWNLPANLQRFALSEIGDGVGGVAQVDRAATGRSVRVTFGVG